MELGVEHHDGWVSLTLNRPEVGNAYDGALIDAGLRAIDQLERHIDRRFREIDAKLDELMSYLDDFDPAFNIVEPRR